MGKNHVENSLKRFLKRKVKITMGFVVAFMIMGTWVFAEDSYYAKEKDISVKKTEDITAKVNTDGLSEGANKFTAIGAEAGKTLTLTTEGKINIVNDEAVSNPQRLYGITLNGGANADITASEINFNITAPKDGVRVVGVRNNGGNQLNIKSNITGSLTGNGEVVVGFDTWSGGSTTIDGDVNNLTLNSNSGYRVMGVQQSSTGGKTIFNGNVTMEINSGNDIVEGIYNNRGAVDFNKNVDLTINSNSLGETYIVNGESDKGQPATIVNFNGNKTTFTINSTKTNGGGHIFGLSASGEPVVFNFKGQETNIFINANNVQTAMALNSQYSGKITSDEGTKINIRVINNSNDSNSNTYGLYLSEYAHANGNMELNGSVDITTQANAGFSGGIVNIADPDVVDKNDGKVLIGENLKISSTSKTGQAVGIYTTGIYGETKLNGNTIIEVKGNEDSYAVAASDSGKIDILGKDKLIQITGDIAADTSAKISANLSTSDSFITGTITDNSQDTANKGTVNIGMDNGATWNNTGDSSVTELTLNNGVINNDSVDNNISVGTLLGNGGIVNMAAVIDEKTGEAKSGKVTINKIKEENVKLDVNFKNTGTVEADGDKAQEYFEELAKNIETTDTDSKIIGTAALDEGFVSGGYEADITINKDGSKVENVTYTGLNSMVEGMRDLATINLLTWRQEMNSLNKRMGELRNSTGEHGVWSRVYTGKIENGSKYDNDYQTYQVGYDKKYTVDNGVMFVGGLVSYTDGETDYALGHGENYSVGAGIYATWLNNDGQFADVVLKQSRLHNKFDVRSKDLDKSQSGDYNNWGTSLNGQYGKRFDLNDKFFVEPSVELTLGRVDDTTYTTSAGVDVHQDTMYSLVGNVGTSVGYKFSDKGNVYARAALVKEFQGDIDTEYEKDGALERTSEDLGDTWAEFGVGVNYRFVENMNVYVDVQKTGEATVDNKWQANLGFRYEF